MPNITDNIFEQVGPMLAFILFMRQITYHICVFIEFHLTIIYTNIYLRGAPKCIILWSYPRHWANVPWERHLWFLKNHFYSYCWLALVLENHPREFPPPWARKFLMIPTDGKMLAVFLLMTFFVYACQVCL